MNPDFSLIRILSKRELGRGGKGLEKAICWRGVCRAAGGWANASRGSQQILAEGWVGNPKFCSKAKFGMKEKSRLKILVATILITSLWLVTGCGKQKETTKGVVKEKPPLSIGYSLSSIGHQFFVNMLDGIKKEAAKQGINVLVATANADAAKQLTDVEDLLQKGVKVMMITPQDSDAIKPAVLACNKAKVPVVIVDIGASGGKVDCLIISDNLKGGRLAGEYIAKRLKKGSKVVHIQCQVGAANARKRGEGFLQVMKEKGIKVVAQQPADSRRDLAMTVMENILQAQPQIDAVFAENDPMAVGVMLAAKNAGRLKNMIIVGFNGDKEALDAIAKGDMKATIMQFPYEMGAMGVQAAVKLAKGEKVEKVINVPVELVTKENLSQYGLYKRK